MGNPILSDDAIGVRLAADFKASLRAGTAPGTRNSFRFAAQLARAANSSLRREANSSPRSGLLPNLDIIEECSVGGLNLLDLLRGYQRVIVLDSLQTSKGTPGAWHRFTAEALRQTVHLTNIHDANFATALELGRRIGLPLADDAEIHIFAVEIQDNHTFSERMTPAMERAYPRLRAAIFKEVRELVRDSGAAEATRPTPPNRKSLLTSAATALRANQRQPRTVSTVCLSTN